MNLDLLLFTVAVCLLSHNGEPMNTGESGAITSKSEINIALSFLRRVFGVFQVGNIDQRFLLGTGASSIQKLIFAPQEQMASKDLLEKRTRSNPTVWSINLSGLKTAPPKNPLTNLANKT
ncbi:hypothetical protein FCULG_00011576 [Fusarium culmorum]|uniref:Uncharacterized protein n=1 Tax=Fusarium culmorum TaxID=5516 RepID=A0A2T4H5N2_FUSCU|nr:hypothetical protein FCULG_00011576 [Fusarium culmorum]